MRSVDLSRQISLNQAGLDRSLLVKRYDLSLMQERLSTGKAINRASDDATGFAMARRMEGVQNQYNQYMASIESAQPWVDQTQYALDSLAELFTQVRERGVQGSNDTLSANDREAIASSIDSLADEALLYLNAKSAGEFIFAGTATTTTPFTEANDVVTYNGNTGTRSRNIGPATSLTINIDGDRLLDTGNGYTIMESLTNLSAALRSGVRNDIDTALGEVTASQEHILDLASEAGTKANRLQTSFNHLSEAILLVEHRRSRYEDADLASTITEMQVAQTGLQAALQAIASSQQISLLNYL